MTRFDLPEDLLALERTAWTEIQEGRLSVDTAASVHHGVTAFVERTGLRRIEVEAALKFAVRHSSQGKEKEE